MAGRVETRKDGTEVHFSDRGFVEYTTEKDGSKTYYDLRANGKGVYNQKKDGSIIYYKWNGFLNWRKDPALSEVVYVRTCDVDKDGNATYYSGDGKTVQAKIDCKGNETVYYKNGVIKSTYDKNKKIRKEYREDGTLEAVENLRTKVRTEYARNGKTADRIYTESDNSSRDLIFIDGKVVRENSYYEDREKSVEFNYNDDGLVGSWTVDKRKWLEDGEEKSSITYKRDDVNAVLSGDVSGIAYLDAGVPNYFGKDGEAVWKKAEKAKKKANEKITARKTAKATQKKSTSNAIKVQKEKQSAKGFTVGGISTPWAEAAQKKVEAKANEKAKSTQAKRGVAKKPTKINSSRS